MPCSYESARPQGTGSAVEPAQQWDQLAARRKRGSAQGRRPTHRMAPSAGPMSQNGNPRDRLRVLDLWLAGVMTLWLLALHVAAARNGGGLWRDEVVTVNLAHMPSLWEMLSHNYYDSFPSLFSLILRAWIALGLGETDQDLRMLSMILGFCMTAGLWWSCRRFGCTAPLLSLALFGLFPVAFRLTNGVRAYTLGVLTMLVTLVMTWLLVRHPTRKRSLLTSIAALLSVHAHYSNAPMLIACLAAGAAVCLRHGRYKTILTLLGIGVACALSLLVYIPAIKSHSRWNFLMAMDVGPSWLFYSFWRAIEHWQPLGQVIVVAWFLLVLLTIGGCSYRFNRSENPGADARGDLALFALTSLVAGFVCLFGYLKVLSVSSSSSPAYYLPLLALVAVSIESGVDLVVGHNRLGRAMRTTLVAAIAEMTASGNWKAAHARFTNLDLIAGSLTTLAQRSDLIIVSPWYTGVTFNRYYHGSAAWDTLPELGEYLYQHYQPLQDKMMSENPINGLLKRVELTLRAGGRIWFVVGSWAGYKSGQPPTYLPPSQDGGRTGSSDREYMASWLQQLGRFLEDHVLTRQRLELNHPTPLLEEAELFCLSGWHE